MNFAPIPEIEDIRRAAWWSSSMTKTARTKAT